MTLPYTKDALADGTPTARETRLWHSQAHMPSVKNDELLLVEGRGAYVWDERGRKLLDVPASLWYCNIGHGRAEIAEAVAAQIRRLEAYSTFQRSTTAPARDLAERLAALAPVDDARVFLTSGGSDSVDTAVKLVRRYWHAVGRPEKRTIVTREGGYHGLHGFGTSITGIEANREGLGSLPVESVRAPAHDAEALVRLLEEEGDGIAAFVCEPVIGTGGVHFPREGYLEAAQRACAEHDVAFVVDEVITGFGRTGAMFASERFGLRPDLLLLAKGITSGYLPLGAVVVSRRFWEPFWRDGSDLVFRHGLTYSGHATACAAAAANLDVLDRERLVDRVRRLERPLADALAPLSPHPLVTEVRTGAGLLAAVDVVDAGTAQRVAVACLDHGILPRVITDRTFQISPPFVVDENELRFVADALRACLDTVGEED